MQILMIGLSHRTADVALREKFNLSDEHLSRLYNELRRENPHVEVVAIATCNRTEIYLARHELAFPKLEDMQSALARCCAANEDELADAAQSRKGDDAVRHLFAVACGLDSMVLGEPQILGQVKRAYEAANSKQMVGPILHRVFQEAITNAKAVRQETGIDEGRMSVASVAADFARQIFSHFDDKTIVAIGAGEMAKVTLKHLHGLEPAKLFLTNRSRERAEALLHGLGIDGQGGAAIRPFDELDDLLTEADIVLASTGAPHPIITAKRFKSIHRKRRGRPLFIIDIALPRDADPEIGELANVYLYNIDDLQRVVTETHGNRCAQVQRCRERIDRSVRTCMSQIQNRDVGQLIRQLRDQLRDLGDAEKQRSMRKIDNLAADAPDDRIEAILDEHTNRLINKFLHIPLKQLDQKNADAPLGFAAAALRHLFRLDDSQTPGNGQVETKDDRAADVENSNGQRPKSKDAPDPAEIDEESASDTLSAGQSRSAEPKND